MLVYHNKQERASERADTKKCIEMVNLIIVVRSSEQWVSAAAATAAI